MNRLVMRGLYVVAVAFFAPYDVNSGADAKFRASLTSKVLAVALNAYHQQKPALAKLLSKRHTLVPFMQTMIW